MNDSKLLPPSATQTPTVSQRSSWLGWLKSHWFLMVSITVGTSIGAATMWAQRQSSHVPEFYSRALNRTESGRAEDRTQLLAEVQQLQDDASRRGLWNANFDQDRINAWLGDEIPRKFARLLAHGADEPAIAIENGAILAAVRYKSSRWDTVVSCRLSVEMTEEPNLLAVRLSDLKAGLLPLPLEPFVRRISKEAALGDLDIHWDFTESGPVALVTIPHDDPRYVFQPVIIESIELGNGELTLAGRTGNMAANDYRPRGPVHRFVSFRPRRIATLPTDSPIAH